MPKRPKMDISNVLAPERNNADSQKHASNASTRRSSQENTEILHVYMPAELKDRFRNLQAQLQLQRGESWKLSEIARAILSIGLEAGEEEIIESLQDERA